MPSIQTPHDALYKRFFSNPDVVASFLQDFVPESLVRDLDFSTLERLSGNYVSDSFKERYNDIVWRIRWKKSRLASYLVVMLEFQSSPDYWMALRINAYTTLLLQDLIQAQKLGPQAPLPFVLPIVLYNGTKSWNAPTNVADLFGPPFPEELCPFVPRQQHFLLNVSTFPKEMLDPLRGIAAQILKLEREKSPVQFLKVYWYLYSLVQGPEFALLRQALATWVVHYLLEKLGITVDFSKVCDLQEIGAMLENRAEEWKNMFLAEGREERDQQITALQKRRIIKLLEERFGHLPPCLAVSIERISDPEVLTEFIILACTTNSLQDFEAKSATEHLSPRGQQE